MPTFLKGVVVAIDISRVPKEYEIPTIEQRIQQEIDWRQWGIDNGVAGAKEKGTLSRAEAELYATGKRCPICGVATPEKEAVIKELEKIRLGEIPDRRLSITKRKPSILP